MSRQTKWALAALAAGCGGWAWFLSTKPLDQADQWSSVMAGFAALVFGMVGVVMAVLAWRQAAQTTTQPTPAPPPHPGQPQAAGPRGVSTGGDNSGVIITGNNNYVDRRP